MMKKLIILSTLIIGFTPANSQEKQLLTLGDCYRDALIVSPLADERQALSHLYQLKDKNIQSRWYPSLDAGANILYNTNVVDLANALESLPIPGIPDEIGGMPHDQYKLTVDVNQVIYDGGVIKETRKAEMAALSYDIQIVDAELYKRREQINNTFFAIAILRKQVALLESYQDLMDNQLKSVMNAIENGVLLETDFDILRSEIIKIKQQLAEAEFRISGLFSVLSDITGREYDIDTELRLPQIENPESDLLTRPELKAFELKITQLESGRDLLRSSRKPKAFGFATIGYGSPPGNDFFTDSFGPYATIGAGIKWSITDWNRTKRNEQIIDLNKTIIGSRKQELEGNLRRALVIKNSEIESLISLLRSDEELIAIRKSITEATGHKLNNGSITATEYLTELNAEKQAVLNREIHLVTLSKNRVEYLYISGKEIE